jgi:23S rRNA (cytidine1920-2'-O)/16S rRNA (cytidine1409-2'-O)-methyltransferase
MKIRLDQLVIDRGLAASRTAAQGLIRAGQILVGDHRVDKPGQRVLDDSPLRIKGSICPYVSRGGVKLAAALIRFGLADLNGTLALDVGASTGGFTDCMLKHGAEHVWAVDTGRGQLHMDLRRDPRVTLRERSNARFLAPDWVEGRAMDLIAIDVAFISLRLILPPMEPILAPGGSVVALVKPQFEAAPQSVGAGGVVRDRTVHRRVLNEILEFARGRRWHPQNLCPSPLLGPAGNREFFIQFIRPASDDDKMKGIDQNDVEHGLDEAYSM